MPTKLNLKTFEKKMQVRPLRPSDYEAVAALGVKSFPGMKPWTKEQFKSTLENYPQGQIGIEYNQRLVASCASLIVDSTRYTEWHNWHEIADAGYIRNHDPAGDTLYGIEIMVDPAYRGLKLARRLYDERKRLAREGNLAFIIIGGRIPGYGKHAAKLTAREYVDQVVSKQLHDPVLTTQLSNGFVLKRLIPNYMPSDDASRGYATYLEWANLDYQAEAAPHHGHRQSARVCVVQYLMRTVKNFEEFARNCEYFVDVASDYRSDFILFPELFTTQLLSTLPRRLRPGISARRLAEFTPRYLEMFSTMAVKYNLNIIGGSQFTIEDEKLFNVSYLFRRDGTLGKQYKLHATPNERRWWGVSNGDKLEVFDTDRGRIAILVCYDVEFPELARIATAKGARILFVPFNTDERYGYLRIRLCAQARCVENHVYSVIAGCVGNLPAVENADVHYAQSGIYTPSDFPFDRDAVASECADNIETVIIHDLDLGLVGRHRESGTTLNWKDRRTDLYGVRYTQDGGSEDI